MKLALISGATEAEEINIKISYFSFGVQIANQKGDFLKLIFTVSRARF